MATTYKAIATVTVGSGGASSIAFSSIPGTYTDLVIKLSARTDRASFPGDGVSITFNSTAANAARGLAGNGSAASSDTDLLAAVAPAATATASTFGNAEIYIPNYTSSNNKSISGDAVNENNNTTATTRFSAELIPHTSAITSISLTPFLGTNFVQYSTATLYGIKNS